MYALLLGAFLLFPVTLHDYAQAQYFGRNKVQYRSFDFKVLQTEHFDIYHYDEQEDVIADFGRMAERWYTRLSSVLQHELRGRQPIILYASHPDFQQTNAIPGEIGEATGGATEILKRRIVMPQAGPLPETDHVLGHELVHAFQFDITGQAASAVGFQIPGAMRLPLWFVEGMAEYLSLGPADPHTAMWLRDAALHDDLPSVRRLGHPRYFPYRFGQAFWAYVAGRWGDEVIGRMLKSAGRTGDPEGAIREILGVSPEELSHDWHEAVQKEFEPIVEEGLPPEDYGRTVISSDTQGGRVNVGPALSPDGRELVFLSERDIFSIEMFLADAETGRVKRRITRTALDPHFESLQFVNSAGAWSLDGRQFAFGAVSRGRAVLTILDMARNRVIREVPLPGLGQVFNPAWSPDGRKIAFSGISGGPVDLFLYDLEGDEIQRLTDDAFAALQPAWSPDGEWIAFVTDRFTSDLTELSFGHYGLALYQVRTGQLEPLSIFDRGKHINPQWAPDGRALYFLSDARGVTDLYRYSLENGRVFEVTRLRTGISGISKLSPALSAAGRAERVAVGVFKGGEYRIVLLDSAQVLAGRAVVRPLPVDEPGFLPPRQRASADVSSFLASPRRGLIEPVDFETVPYRPRLSLDYVAQPAVAVGATSTGAFVGGGTALFWSDMLGDHNLMTLFQVNAEVGNFQNELAGIGVYENRRRRWNWGGIGGQIPFLTGSFRTGMGVIDGEPVAIEETTRFVQTNRELSAFTAYPFSRAQRLEFSGGYQNISFFAETRTRVFSRATGTLLSDRRQQLPSPSAVHLGTVRTALVYDTSLFGGTSPILGQRYRFEISNSSGSLQYQSLLADYRHYYMFLRPLTLAGRALHFGRYGQDSEDERLRDLFVGFPSLVRGYSPGSFSPAECLAPEGPPGTCPVFDRLVGSRAMVGNLELRVPLFGFLGVVRSPGVPPVEASLFFDGGAAWTQADRLSFRGGSRTPVTSHGVSFRINLLGFAVAQISLVHPNDRPLRGWMWEFGFTPGF